jgi:DNA mismatch endonuclease (patch repair protein)
MADIVSSSKRSEMMAGIKSKDTKPEMIIRKELHKKGFRYRLHAKDLPGNPDLFLRKYNAAIFVHGCFWHVHNCHLFKLSKTRTAFWKKKLEDNKKRDDRNISILLNNNYRVCVIWECAIKNINDDAMSKVIDTITVWIQTDNEYLELP